MDGQSYGLCCFLWINGSRLFHEIVKQCLLIRLAQPCTAGLEEWSQTLCHSLNGLPRITGKGQQRMGNCLQNIRVCAAGFKRGGDVVRRQVRLEQLFRLAWKQNRKRRRLKIRDPYLLRNPLMPSACARPYDRLRERLVLHELA